MQHLDRRLEHLDEFHQSLVRLAQTSGIAIRVRVVLLEIFELADVYFADEGRDVLVVFITGFGLGNRDLVQNRRLDLDHFELGNVATELVQVSAPALTRVFFSDSGSAAVEVALKMAFQKHSPASRIISFQHCFAGRTLALAQVTDKDKEAFKHIITEQIEAFRDDNEDGVFSGRFANGNVLDGAADVNAKCYGGGNIECYQVGGDNEEYIDLNGDHAFNEGNGIYNGVLCALEGDGCSKQLVTIWKNITILQSGPAASIAMIARCWLSGLAVFRIYFRAFDR